MVETRHVEIPGHGGRVDLSRPHVVGIAGQGMSALAHLLSQSGATVTGSDLRSTTVTAELTAAGCTVHHGHDARSASLAGGASAVVWSSAVSTANPELAAARAAGIAVVHRSDVLAQLLDDAGTSVVVTGTHGKSTVTGMLAAAVRTLNPSWTGGGSLVGGVNGYHGAGTGGGTVFIAEGDESDRSVSRYRPDLAVVLNVDDDHPETLLGIEDTVGVFYDLALNAGTLLVSADDPGARLLTERARGIEGLRVVTVGESDGADVRITGIRQHGEGSTVTVREADGTTVRVLVPVPGRHNAVNGAVAFAAGRLLGVDAAELVDGLGAFAGIRRRMTVTGTADGVSVRDSYAHHPTAIRADITAARDLVADTEGRLLVVFEPSGTARTAALGPQMGEALAAADSVIILDVHRTVASPITGVTSNEIAPPARAYGATADLVHDHTEAALMVACLAWPGDLVLTMGTGAVSELGGRILDRLSLTAPAAAV